MYVGGALMPVESDFDVDKTNGIDVPILLFSWCCFSLFSGDERPSQPVWVL